MVGVAARREQVAYARRRGLSQRRSCTLLGVARSALGYRSTKAEKDAPVLSRMAALGARYPRFGYRRIRIFLDREGHAMSWGRCYRLWRRAKLQVLCAAVTKSSTGAAAICGRGGVKSSQW